MYKVRFFCSFNENDCQCDLVYCQVLNDSEIPNNTLDIRESLHCWFSFVWDLFLLLGRFFLDPVVEFRMNYEVY